MIDAEVYMGQLLTAAYDALAPDPRPKVAPDIDTGELDAIPFVAWNLTGGGETANGDGLWSYLLHANVFGEGMDQAKAANRDLYDIVHGWGDDPASTKLTIDGVDIWVSSVDDQDLPSRLPSADIPGRHIVQYSGAYAILLRSA